MTKYTEKQSASPLVFILSFYVMQPPMHFVFDLHKCKCSCKVQVSGQCNHLICSVTLHGG